MKTIGILGGVGPQTTSKIYHSIIDSFRENGKRYPAIVIYNLPFPFVIENEAIIEGRNSQKMIPYLIEGAKVLEKSGATFGILPCNTLHKYIDDIRKSVTIPFLSILDETATELKILKIQKVGILATQSSVKDHLYDAILKKNKIEIMYPAKYDQHELDKIIIKLIKNKETKTDIKKFEKICTNMIKDGAKAILLACTDLQSIAEKIETKIPTIDTTHIIIKASLRELGNFKS